MGFERLDASNSASVAPLSAGVVPMTESTASASKDVLQIERPVQET